MELDGEIDISVICPITVTTEFRQNSLIQNKQAAAAPNDNQKSLSVDKAVDEILVGIDHRIPKLVWPSWPFIGVVFKDIFPDRVYGIVKNMAKM